MWESREAPGPCSIAALWDCARSSAARSRRSVFTRQSRILSDSSLSGFIDELARPQHMEAKPRHQTDRVARRRRQSRSRRSTGPRRSRGKPAAERIQVHPASHHRDAAGRRRRRASAHRDPGRMRRPPEWEGRTNCSARSSSEAPIEPAWAWASRSADGALRRTTAGFTRATFLIVDASSRSICPGFQFVPFPPLSSLEAARMSEVRFRQVFLLLVAVNTVAFVARR